MFDILEFGLLQIWFSTAPPLDMQAIVKCSVCWNPCIPEKP